MKHPKHLIKIDRPLCIFIQPNYDHGHLAMWNVSIVGHELDNGTLGDSAVDAAYMAADALRMLTGGCKPMDPTPHDWSIETTLESGDEPKGSGPPAWECSRCGEKCAKADFEDV